MKFVSSAITVLAVASSAAAFAPVQSTRGHAASVSVQSSLTEAFELGAIESEVSGVIAVFCVGSCWNVYG